MNVMDILLLAVIAAGVVLVVRKMIRDKKEGKSCCGCSCGGSCGSSHCGCGEQEEKRI